MEALLKNAPESIRYSAHVRGNGADFLKAACELDLEGIVGKKAGSAYIGGRSITLIPGKAQNFFEVVISGMEEFMVDVTGEEGRWFFPLVGTIFLYIVTCNLIGLIPGFFPPTASINTTLSCALASAIRVSCSHSACPPRPIRLRSYNSRIAARRILPLEVFNTVCGGASTTSSGGRPSKSTPTL